MKGTLGLSGAQNYRWGESPKAFRWNRAESGCFQGKMKPLRLRAGVKWEQGLLGSALREGIPLARGAARPLKRGRVAENEINKEPPGVERLVRSPLKFPFLLRFNQRQIRSATIKARVQTIYDRVSLTTAVNKK